MSKSNESKSKPTHPRSVRINVHQEAVQACLDYVNAIETRKLYQSRPEDSETDRALKSTGWLKAFNDETNAIDRMYALVAVLKLSK